MSTGRRRVSDPDDYQPPLRWLATLRDYFESVAVKVSPAIDDEAFAYPDVHVEFISDRGECKEAVLWFGPGIAVCQALGADPWSTLASGTLLAVFPPEAAGTALQAFADQGHRAAVIGTSEPGAGLIDTDGHAIPWPERDEVARLLSATGSPSTASEA